MIELEKKLCVVSIDTLQELFELGGGDVVALYMFYYKQCKIQRTNQSRSTDSFVLKGLSWGQARLRKSKKILKSKGLIDFVVNRNKDGKIEGHYIKLNYIRKQANVDQYTQNALVEKATSGKQQTNALSDKEEMLKVNKKKLEKYISFWNSILFKGKIKDLPKTRKATENIKKARQKASKDFTYDEIIEGTKKYCKDCVSRGESDDPTSYANHRFTLQEFLGQKNGLEKFFNS